MKQVLSALWIAMLFVFAYVDIFAFFRTDVLRAGLDGPDLSGLALASPTSSVDSVSLDGPAIRHCERTRIIGMHSDGVFAEYIAAPHDICVTLPDHASRLTTGV